jgi:hypothetical protein
MVDQARQASDRLIDAERMKASAIQEAAYYRTKLAALESSNETDVLHVERERVSDLERHMSALMSERWTQDRKMSELKDDLALQTTLYEHAEARAADASKRAETAEESHERTLQRHEGLERHMAMVLELVATVGSEDPQSHLFHVPFKVAHYVRALEEDPDLLKLVGEAFMTGSYKYVRCLGTPFCTTIPNKLSEYAYALRISPNNSGLEEEGECLQFGTIFCQRTDLHPVTVFLEFKQGHARAISIKVVSSSPNEMPGDKSTVDRLEKTKRGLS